MVVIIVPALLILGIASCYLNLKSTMDTVSMSMEETAKLAADRVYWEVERYKTIAAETGCIAMLSNEDVTLDYKQRIMNSKLQNYNLVESNIIDINGINLFNGVDCSDREYFKQAMAGNVYISEPSVSKVTGKLTMMISAPMWKDGVIGGRGSGSYYADSPGGFSLSDYDGYKYQ